MNRRYAGFGLIGLGSVVTVVGLALFATSGSGATAQSAAATTVAPAPSTAGSTATPPPATTTTTTATTTTTPATTTAPSTTTTPTSAPTTTVAPPTTIASTTTIDAGAQVEAFIAEFAAATSADDVDFLVARLHPLTVQASDPETCAAFVSREIVALEQYRATGPPQQTVLQLTIDDQVFAVDPAFEVPVEFSFGGQDFTDDAKFAPVDGVMHYFATCR